MTEVDGVEGYLIDNDCGTATRLNELLRNRRIIRIEPGYTSGWLFIVFDNDYTLTMEIGELRENEDGLRCDWKNGLGWGKVISEGHAEHYTRMDAARLNELLCDRIIQRVEVDSAGWELVVFEPKDIRFDTLTARLGTLRTTGGCRKEPSKNIAIHEAGHAVMHIRMGGTIGSVDVVPTPTSQGGMNFKRKVSCEATVAGHWAALNYGDGTPEHPSEIDGDQNRVNDSRVWDDTMGRLTELASSDPTLELQIKAVAASLVQKRSLTGEEVKQIMAAAAEAKRRAPKLHETQEKTA